MLEGTATALGSVMVVGLIGYGYHVYYKSLVLRKMELAFSPGYSSSEEAALARHDSTLMKGVKRGDVEHDTWVNRTEQATIDKIVDGTTQGHYYLINGEKGTGKASMLFKSMQNVEGAGIAAMEAHGDLEVFRLRLGKALNYDFHEDYIGGLFSFKGPRDASPLLDIERAFNKMEKIALKRRSETGKPLILIINRAHLLRDDDEGRHLLEALQQRAEIWAASRLVTVVFNSDEYWIEERLRPLATRMRVIPVHDVPKDAAIAALKGFRAQAFQEDTPAQVLEAVYQKVGGRLRFLSQVGNAVDMEEACRALYEKEKRWFLNQCWIYGPDLDDDAEDHQTFCSSAMILAKAFVEKQNAYRTSGGTEGLHFLPGVPLHEARQIMGREDFIQRLDQLNIFSINSSAIVQADSVVMQNVFREICQQEGFEEHLKGTLERLDELESLGRTNEVTFKELADNGALKAVVGKDSAGNKGFEISIRAVPAESEDSWSITKWL